MQELEKILREIEAEFDRCIDIQLKIMAGLGDDVYRYGYGKSLEAYQQGKLFVEDIIRKHMNDGWIPVEERLPEYNESGFYDAVNVTMKNGSVTHGCYRNYDEEWWVASEYGEFKYTQSSEVIAWSPLPEPYHPERSDSHDGK